MQKLKKKKKVQNFLTIQKEFTRTSQESVIVNYQTKFSNFISPREFTHHLNI